MGGLGLPVAAHLEVPFEGCRQALAAVARECAILRALLPPGYMRSGQSRAMRAWLALGLLLLAGCMDTDSGTTPETETPVPGDSAEANETAGVPSHDLLDVATAAAVAWDESAKLTMVSMFEGEIPDWSQNVVFGGNRWADPFKGLGGELGDGLQTRWAYTFVADDAAYQAAMAACDAGNNSGEARYYVVVVDESGDVHSEYAAFDDDEGAPHGHILDGDFLNSSAAAEIAAGVAGYADFLRDTDLTQNLLYAADGTAYWFFILHDTSADDGFGDDYRLRIDATTGDVREGVGPADCP